MANIPNPVQQLRSAEAGKVPAPAQLLPGQIAINTTDGTIFALSGDGLTVIQLGVAAKDLALVAFSGSFTDLSNAPSFTPYVLPVSKSDELGGVKIGTGLSIDTAGLLSALMQSVNGRTGAVVLSGQDVGIPNDLTDANQIVQLKYLPSSIVGSMSYEGTYPLSGPALPAPTPENNGWLKVSSEAGSVTLTGDTEPVTLRVGDWLISNGVEWDVIPNVSSTVTTVNEQTGDVVITLTSLNASEVARTGSYEDLLDIPIDFPPSAHTHVPADIIGLALVASTGDFNDLENIPSGLNVANISVSVGAEQFLTQDVSYLFTRAAQFTPNFAGSVCQAELVGATTANVVIKKNGNQIGTIAINVATGTFSSVGMQSFAAGDKLTYSWGSLNIKDVSINLQGTWL